MSTVGNNPGMKGFTSTFEYIYTNMKGKFHSCIDSTQ